MPFYSQIGPSDVISSSGHGLFQADKVPELMIFKLKQGCTRFTIYMSVFQTFIALTNIFQVHHCDVHVSFIIAMFLSIFPGIFGWSYIVLSKNFEQSDVLTSQGKSIIFCGNAVILSQAISSGIFLLSFAYADSDGSEDQSCFYLSGAENDLPLRILIFVMGGNIAIPMVFKSHDIAVCLASIVVTYVVICVAAFVIPLSAGDIAAICVMGIIIFFTFMSYEESIVSNFSTYSQLKVARSESIERLMRARNVENQAEDKRLAIGKFCEIAIIMPNVKFWQLTMHSTPFHTTICFVTARKCCTWFTYTS
jgi:hypothetical protein